MSFQYDSLDEPRSKGHPSKRAPFVSFNGVGSVAAKQTAIRDRSAQLLYERRYRMIMRDSDVRRALHKQLLQTHATELDNTLFVDELGLCGEARVDVAVVNASLSGFELKSASDSLRRLPTQIEVYSRVLDYATLVVAENHLDRSLPLLPNWWGCSVVRWDGTLARIDELRPATFNPLIDPYSIAQLLWWDEAFGALETLQAAKGMRSKPRKKLWAKLVETTDLSELRSLVRTRLKTRTGWRSETTSARFGPQLAAYGAMSPL